jgi:hypothetical protein
MATKSSLSIPETAEHAVNQGYKKTPIVHATLPVAEKKNWALVKPGSPHIICYYDPNTGEYTDCHTSDEG